MTGALVMDGNGAVVRVVQPGTQQSAVFGTWAGGVLIQSVDDSKADPDRIKTALQYKPGSNTLVIGSEAADQVASMVRLVGAPVQAVNKDGTPFMATWPDHVVTKQYVDQAVASGGGKDEVWHGTKAEYDALPAKDPDVLYVIEEATGSVLLTETAAEAKFGGGLVPIGGIIPFGGSVAPTGWHLCDGTAHGSAALKAVIGADTTPNLLDRFVIGAGTKHPLKATGGAETVTLTAAQSGVPGHTHPVTVAAGGVAHTHPISHDHGAFNTGIAGGPASGSKASPTVRRTDLANADTGPDYVSASTATLPSISNHTHPVDVPAFSGTSGAASATSHGHTASAAANAAAAATAAHENMPPFYALTYIIRKS
jgi:microcystin-dependent protein